MSGAAVMRGVSRESLDAARRELDAVLGRPNRSAALGPDLFAMARTIDSSVNLRRALTDPNAQAADKASIVNRLFAGRVSSESIELLKSLVSSRWAAARDLADAAEILGTTTVLVDAESEGSLDTVEDELFRFGRIVAGNTELERALSDESRSTQDRARLVEGLLGLRANPRSTQLITQAVTAPRGRRLDQAFEEFSSAIAERRQQSVARVTSAVPLTEDQSRRLQDTLTRLYGRPVHLNLDIDPNLVGGIRVQVGNEVIDGSVSSRLDEAKRRLAG